MKHCDQFQTQLLEHLYGVLEPDESHALADHLGGCSACQAELVRAEEEMALIAAAAKAEFPWVRFDIPKEALSPSAPQPVSRGAWLRWGVAAAVLLALGGIGIPSVWFLRQQERVAQAETTYKDAQDALAELDARQQSILQSAQSIKKDFRDKADAVAKALNDLQGETRQLAEDWRKERAKTFADLNAKQMNLTVIGPKTLEAGGLNPFQILTRDLRQRSTPARISLSVSDQDGQVVYKQEDVPSQGTLNVPLPRDLPLKPNTQLNLQVSARGEQGQQGLVKETISLTGPLYLTHLATDKPTYRPGETVRFRSLTLDRFSLKPAADDFHLIYSLSKPTGEKTEILRGMAHLLREKDKKPILGPDQKPVRGIGGGEYRIDPEASSGEYTLTVSEAENAFPPQSRKFRVSRYQKAQQNQKPGSGGNAPNAGEKKLIVEFFPEGGDLVAGLSNRVYFQARTALGKPAELTGQIVDETSRPVTQVATWNHPDHPEANQGRGVFTFTPQTGKRYQLKIDRPADIEGNYFLPEVKTEGVVMSIAKGVIGDKEPIRVRIQNAGKDRSLFIGAYCRGRLMAQQTVDVKNGEGREVELGPDSGVGGVYRVTVFEREAGQGSRNRLVPRAERLLYRAPAEHLNLAITPRKGKYSPGEKVSLQVEARNEKNEFAPAIVMIAVVDQSVLKRADEKTHRGMPAHFFLTTEIHRPEDLEDANFLLGPKAGAGTALDLLLSTQGWRRFAEQDPEKFLKEQKEEAQNFLVLNGHFPRRTVDYSQEEGQKVAKKFENKALQLEGRLAKAEEEQISIRKGEQQKKELARLKKEAEADESKRLAAVAKWDDAKTNLAAAANQLNDSKDLVKNRALPALMGLFLIAGLAGLGIGLVRGRTSQAVPYFATAACSLLVFGFLAVIEVALSNGTTFTLGGNETGLARDNTGSGALNGLSAKDRMALFSLEDELMKKDKTDWRTNPLIPGPKIILPIRTKQGSAIQSPPDVAKSIQMDKQSADADKARVPEEPLGQEKPVASQGRIFAGIPLPPPPPPPLVVREYAHVHAKGENQGRPDSTETLFWQPVLVLPDGKGEVTFDLCDSVTTFQVRAVGHTLDGRLAEVAIELISRKP